MITESQSQLTTVAELRARAVERRKRLGLITTRPFARVVPAAAADAARAPVSGRANAPIITSQEPPSVSPAAASTPPAGARARKAIRPPIKLEDIGIHRIIAPLDELPSDLVLKLTADARTALEILVQSAVSWAAVVSDMKCSTGGLASIAARNEVYYLLRQHLGWEWRRINTFMGGRAFNARWIREGAARHAQINGLPPVDEVITSPFPWRQVLGPVLVVTGMHVTGPALIERIAAAHNLTANDITSKCRLKHFILARQEVMYVLVVGLGFKNIHVGRLLNRDHSTVLSGVRAYANRYNLPPRREIPPTVKLGLVDIQHAIDAVSL